MQSTAEENTPKHVIGNSEAFHKGREQLGNLILKKMSITGGTDVDWLVERKGGFIILESKEFSENIISISLGQMIAFESLYNRLISGENVISIFLRMIKIQIGKILTKLFGILI